MKSFLITLFASASVLSAVAGTPPAPVPFKGSNYAGTYACTGNDSKEGPYTATVTLTLDAAHSTGPHGAYAFRMEVPGYGVYLGQAVSLQKHLAIHFALENPKSKDYGTGLAVVSRRKGQTVFTKFYYEPDFKGGNHGFEDCVKQ